MLINVLPLFDPKGHRESRNEVGSPGPVSLGPISIAQSPKKNKKWQKMS